MANGLVYRQRRRDKFGNIKLTCEIVRRVPTHAELLAIIHYDPETGRFTHLRTSGKARKGAEVGKINCFGYREMRIFNRLFTAGRIAWFYMTGQWPEQVIDHINGDRSDNRWCNLRSASYLENNWNAPVSKNCKSGLKGAWPCKTTGRWQSLLTDGRKRIWLGRFDTAEEAHEAWIEAAVRLRGEEWMKRAMEQRNA